MRYLLLEEDKAGNNIDERGEGRQKDAYWEIKASVFAVLSGIVDVITSRLLIAMSERHGNERAMKSREV